MVVHSIANNSYVVLGSGESFEGGIEVTTGGVSICVSTFCSSEVKVIIKQYRQNAASTLMHNNEENVAADTKGLVQTPVKAGFFSIKVENLGASMTFTNITTVLQETHFINLDIRSLTGARDSVTIAGGTITPSGTQDVNVTNDVVVQGQNNNYEFYPTPENNIAAVYADGTQGVNVTGGWSYSNLATGKINWYLYGSTGLATDYKVSELNSMYAVVNNQSTLGLALAQNPWVMIYTRPDSGTNGAGWYKSKLFFGSNAHTDVTGIKLLYTGSDPIDVHPEITGINRIQLIFVEALSTKPLAQAQNENIMLGSLQTTNNTAQAGAFNFVMQEFGADWVKTPSILPIEFNKVMCDTTGSAVTVSSGTVAVSSQPHLSYLTDNIAVATMPSITGTVVVSSQPALSYLTDNIAVATMPAITGTVAVSSMPFLSYLTSNIAVATQPALAFSTDKVDATGSAVTISRTTSSVTSWENPTSIISFDSGSTVRQIKGTAGSLHSLSITNDNNSLAYVALYDELATNVTAGVTTPKAVFTINKNQQIQLPLHAVAFSTAISYFTATTYNGGTPQTLVYLTASYNG